MSLEDVNKFLDLSRDVLANGLAAFNRFGSRPAEAFDESNKEFEALFLLLCWFKIDSDGVNSC